MPVTPITPAQIDEVARLAEIPPVGSEERDFWLEAAEQHGFEPIDEDGYTRGEEERHIATERAILTLMSEARRQGQRDVLSASSETTGLSPIGHAPTGHEPAAVDPSRGPLKRVRHIKNGTEYEVLGIAKMQASYNRIDGSDVPMRAFQDDDEIVVYRSSEGRLYARFEDEFSDGRFETISAPGFAAANPSGGWRPIETAPNAGSDDRVWVLGGRYERPTLVPADGSYWRYEARAWSGNPSIPTHWHPEIVPAPPSALAGEARQGQDAQRLDPKDDHAASSEATPSIPSPPSPRKGQEENPCPMTVEEARALIDGLDKRKKPAMHILACRKASQRCSSVENADKLIAKADRIELALSTIRASEEDR